MTLYLLREAFVTIVLYVHKSHIKAPGTVRPKEQKPPQVKLLSI
jgi:hypothetical protein